MYHSGMYLFRLHSFDLFLHQAMEEEVHYPNIYLSKRNSYCEGFMRRRSNKSVQLLCFPTKYRFEHCKCKTVSESLMIMVIVKCH